MAAAPAPGGQPEAPLPLVARIASCCCCARPGVSRAVALLERFRINCVVCLVLDSLFLLIYSITTLSLATEDSARTQCYETHGHKWHHTFTVTVSLNVLATFSGVVVHSAVVCCMPTTTKQLGAISIFASALIVWVFVSATLEFVARQQEPIECAGSSADSEESDESRGPAQSIWQVTYFLLWFAWVTSCVAAAVLARRCTLELAMAEESPAVFVAPQTVGVPVQLGARTAEPAASQVPQASGSPAVAQGMPVVSGCARPDGAASG
eukprot:gnl/TRDRNA2_/TRDRNA2_202993_c0_seq1.p1 gnl/TRDRNA2_/TRDRNA2_202993_c0~~gnl/TRDRNA2_/TRDRNA2_202993_c0_seq1.p1  ORF type:complete len:303 (-),score=22.62 gnl/TRDRNA2_/TRDRNA2_202993_c0_seq1:56-853(-)